ncbi:MAG: molybdopterin-dependent oxidoreductase [Rhizobiales bacterium]|nr:molybdopterin-dependent oxidoreductase [Hyphomicrobiales bacterium]
MSARQTKVTSSHWGAFKVTTENGRIVSVGPFEADPNPSAIPHAVPSAVHHRTRVARPSFRRDWLEGGPERARSERGNDEYIELPWDEALDITAAELDRVRKEHGNGAIFGGSYGWASAGRFHHALSQIHRFLNSIGGYVSSYASYSTAAAQAIIPHVLGMNFLKFTWGEQNSWPMIAEHTELLVMFGGINPKNAQVSMGGVTRHETTGWLKTFSDGGMGLVNISPQRGDAPDEAEWLPIIPGSDTALMLALAHVLETQDLCDRQFLDTHAVGYDVFRRYLTGESDGQPKTPEWADGLCGIAPAVIRDLACKMAAKRTLITVAWSLQRAQNGEQPFWMAATLAAMLGQIGLPGGGIGYGYGAIGGVGVPIKRLDGITLPQGTNPIEDFIPVARIADMLLSPGGRYDFNGQARRYPDIKLVYWCGGNPFHHHQDLNRLANAWMQPDTIIVHEPWWTPTAKRADIVLPATTPYEREDIGRAPSDSFLFHMPKLIDPIAEARNDYDIFSALAKRLGCGDDFTEGRDAEGWLRHLFDRFRQNVSADGIELPSYDELRDRNWIELPIAGAEHCGTPLKAFRDDPEAAPLGTPSGKIEIFSQTIDGFGYKETPGHPVWCTPDEWLGAGAAKQYPLHLVSPQPADKLHSQLEAALADIPDARPSPVLINASDAAHRNITDGDVVRVFNGRGSCLARAVVGDRIRDSVIAVPTGAWYDPDEAGNDQQGNPNILTRDIGTSRIGQGSSAHTTLVEVEKLADS